MWLPNYGELEKHLLMATYHVRKITIPADNYVTDSRARLNCCPQVSRILILLWLTIAANISHLGIGNLSSVVYARISFLHLQLTFTSDLHVDQFDFSINEKIFQLDSRKEMC